MSVPVTSYSMFFSFHNRGHVESPAYEGPVTFLEHSAGGTFVSIITEEPNFDYLSHCIA